MIKRITVSVPAGLYARLQTYKHLFNISELVATALDAKLAVFEEGDTQVLAAAEQLETDGGDERTALARRLRAYVANR